jgi:hypothetical protein
VRRAIALICSSLMLAGCGAARTAGLERGGSGIPASLLAGERPIGRGPRFQPPNAGTVTGRCSPTLGAREQAHVELFGANRVVLLAAGIGTRSPRRFSDGRLVRAACFGDIVTLDPTGTVYFRTGTHRLTLGDLFDAWGQRLTTTRIASFSGTGPVRVYVNGHARGGNPRRIPLTAGAEVVLEIGPHVPPHTHFPFPPRPAASLR